MTLDIIDFVEGREGFLHELEDGVGFVTILFRGFGVPVADRKLGDPERLFEHLVNFFQAFEKLFAVGSAVGVHADKVDSQFFPICGCHEFLHPVIVGMNAGRGAEAQSGFHQDGPMLERLFNAHVRLPVLVGFVKAEQFGNACLFGGEGALTDFFVLAPVAPNHGNEIGILRGVGGDVGSPSVNPLGVEFLQKFRPKRILGAEAKAFFGSGGWAFVFLSEEVLGAGGETGCEG